MSDQTRNSVLLWDFVAYCQSHPTERFWQALRNWSGQAFILAMSGSVRTNKGGGPVDTFYWETKDK